MPRTKTKIVSPKSATSGAVGLDKLRGLNLLASGLNLLQGILILWLSDSGNLQPISIHYLTNDRLASAVSGHSVVSEAARHLYDFNLAYLLAAVFFIGALYNAASATFYRPVYEAGLKNRLNRLRWVEFALTGGLMISAIAMLSGILDLAAITMIFLLSAIAGMSGWAVELHAQTGSKVGKSVFRLGAVAGAAPWLAFVIYIIGALVFNGSVPAYLYAIYLSMFVFAALAAANLFRQRSAKGKWRNYAYSERNFVVLGLAAKAALAWQIFFGMLR